MYRWMKTSFFLVLALTMIATPAFGALGLEDCTWSATASGASTIVGEFSGKGGTAVIDDSAWSPLSIDAVVLDDGLQPKPPWLIIRLRNHDRSRLTDPTFISEINFAIPGVDPFQTGIFSRIWGEFRAGPNSYEGNADYLRRDLVGIPGGSGVGHLLTSNVHLTRNDESKVIGSFEARFLDPKIFRQLDILEQHPVGVGVHAISAATIVLTGDFSLLKEGKCGGGFRRPGR
jgi:hypothetical protein